MSAFAKSRSVEPGASENTRTSYSHCSLGSASISGRNTVIQHVQRHLAVQATVSPCSEGAEGRYQGGSWVDNSQMECGWQRHVLTTGKSNLPSWSSILSFNQEGEELYE